ncbi:glycosyltransferase [Nitrogeniibacter aestuarii]|uniref:glycosyltransferase n=1 Tax=Nitrogeniibacter aestuarii TaxID=2815343 RepID=UPI001E4A769F|nr:glycosyltransferase [Nitrogeniibacter aestuarii]
MTPKTPQTSNPASSPAQVGVIVPAYNYGHFLETCLGSLAAQRFGDFTALIIDNASSDNTREIAQAWVARDARFRYVRNDTNIGLSGSLFKAYDLLDNPLMMMLSADDALGPGFLEATAGALNRHPECVFAYTRWQGLVEGQSDAPPPQPYIPHTDSGVFDESEVLLSHNWITNSICLWRREVCDVTGRLDSEGLRYVGDWHLYHRLLSEGPAYFVNDVHGFYRLHGDAESERLTSENRAGVDHMRFYDLLFNSERWSMKMRCLAKAHQIRWMTGEPLMTIVERLGGEHAHPIVQQMMAQVRNEVIVGAARAVLEYTPIPNALDTPGSAFAALSRVLESAPRHPGALALLAEHNGSFDTFTIGHEVEASIAHARASTICASAGETPQITVLVDARNGGPLRRTLRSLKRQSLMPVHVCVIDGPAGLVESSHEQISANTLAPWLGARAGMPGWTLGLVAGDTLEDDALVRLLNGGRNDGAIGLVYADHDELGPDGCARHPKFKPEPNAELLRSTPFIGRAVLLRNELLAEGLAPLDLVSSHRIALSLLARRGADALGHVPDVLMHLDAGTAIDRPANAEQAEALSMAVHSLAEASMPGVYVLDGPAAGQFGWLPPLDSTPLVSIIIPTRDQLDFLTRCLDTLLTETRYPAFEVIVVDNDSQTPAAQRYLAQVAERGDPTLRVIRHGGPFNFSAMNNHAAAEARGDYLVLLNNDTEIVDPMWLTTMMRHAIRDDVGVVGPLLLFPDGRVQHAGVIIGLRGPAEHPFVLTDPDDPGYMGRKHVQQDMSAVTGACLLTRKSLYQSLGGLDETRFAVSYNDIDYCLKVREAGYRVVWSPLARLIHVSSVSQKAEINDANLAAKAKRFRGEQLAFHQRWGSWVANDPAYNPNLDVRADGYRPADDPLLRTHPMDELGGAKIVAVSNGGQDTLRAHVIEPLSALLATGLGHGGVWTAPLDTHVALRLRADCLLLQLPTNDAELTARQAITSLPDVSTCVDGDDLLSVMVMGGARDTDPGQFFAPVMQAFIAGTDRMLVTNERLAQAFAPLQNNICVHAPRLNPGLWSESITPVSAEPGSRPRLAWWALPWTDDTLLTRLVPHFAGRVDFVCLGMAPAELSGHVTSLLPPDELDLPRWLARQSWDISLHPVRDGLFARLGSDIQVTRLAWLGRPLLTSQQPACDLGLPTTALPNTLDAWISAIETLLDDPARRHAEGNALRSAVLTQSGCIEDYAQHWRSVFVPATDQAAPAPLTAEPETVRRALASVLAPLLDVPPVPVPAGAQQSTAAPAPTQTPPIAKASPAQPQEADDKDEALAAARRAVIEAGTADAASRLLDDDYADLLARRAPMDADMQFIEARVATWASTPHIQVLTEARPSEFELLAKTLDSLANQPYGLWHLSVVSSAPCPDPAIAELPNIDWMVSSDAKPCFDSLVDAAAAQIVVYVPPGTVLDPLCLWRVADAFEHQPGWFALYTDDDVMREDDRRVEPRFKPDFNLDLLRSSDYIGPLWIRTSIWASMGGFSALSGARFYDLTLRAVDAAGADAIGHVADPLLSLPVSPCVLIADDQGAQVLGAHLERNGLPHAIRPGPLHGSWCVDYQHAQRPAVDIIIPYRDRLEFMEPLVDSLFERTHWPDFRLILVDADTQDADCARWLADVCTRHGARIKHVRLEGPWNLSRLFNAGAAQADAPYLVFLQHDTQIISTHWLDTLMAVAQRPDVAAVAPRQAKPGKDELTMAGSIFGLEPGIASPESDAVSLNYPGYLGRLQLVQNFNVLDSACLLTSKARFDATGGFDEHYGLRDATVDLSARLGRNGRLVWTPNTTIAHYDVGLPAIDTTDEREYFNQRSERTLGLARERTDLLDTYLPALARDSAWNLNLRLDGRIITPDASFVPPWHAVPTDVAHVVADVVQGAGEFRAVAPLRAARQQGKAQAAIIEPPSHDQRRTLSVIELARAGRIDSLLIHNPTTKQQVPSLRQIRTHLPDLPIIGLLDDLCTAVPRESDMFEFWSRETRSFVRQCLSMCDRLVVSTEPLAEFARHMIDDIRVVPNRVEWSRWGHLSSQRQTGPKPRVGWAGAFQHAGDLAIIEDAVRQTSQEVDWVFFGMCPPSLRPYIKEHHGWVPYDAYPEKLASLNLDLAVAPLEANPFNDAKSNLRLLDYGILGWPVVCSDVTPYRSAPVTRVTDDTAAWVDAIRAHVSDPDAAQRAGDALREWVISDYILEEHVDDWLSHHLP